MHYTYNTIPELFKNIADAIREKEGSAGLIRHQDIPARISLLDGNGSPSITLENITVDAKPLDGISYMQNNDKLPEKLYHTSYHPTTIAKLNGEYYQVGGNNSNTIFYKYLGNDKEGYPPIAQGTIKVVRKDYIINSGEHACDYWLKLTNLPYSGNSIGVVGMKNGIHFFGGGASSNSYCSNKHYKVAINYDAVNNSYAAEYEALTAMPFSRQMNIFWCCNPDEDNIVYLKGSHANTDIQKYNCETDLYEALPAAPARRSYNRIQYYNGYIWMIGGRSDNPGASSTGTYYNTAYRYDIEEDTWETLPNFPVTAMRVTVISEKNNKPFFIIEYSNVTKECGNIYSWDEESYSWHYEGGTPFWHSFYPNMDGIHGLITDDENNIINIVPYHSGDYNYSRDIAIYKELQNYTYYSGYRPNHLFSAFCYCSKDKMVHVIGESYNTLLSNFYVHIAYDFINNRMYRLPDTTYDTRYCDIIEYNGELHILGGNGNPTGHLVYNYDTKSYTGLNSLPIKFTYGNAAILNGRLHIIGGNDTIARKSHYVYNQDTDTWLPVSLINDIPVNFYNGRVVTGEYFGQNCLYYYAPNGDTDGIYIFIDQSTDPNVIAGNWELVFSTGLAATSRVPVAYVDKHLYLLSGNTLMDISEDVLTGEALPKTISLISGNDQIPISNAASCNFASDFKFDPNGECKLYYYPTGSWYVWCLTLKRHCDISNTEQFGLIRNNGTSQVIVKNPEKRRVNF